ncbi:MAG: oligosaccharide flippase family protein [Balneola sp.]
MKNLSERLPEGAKNIGTLIFGNSFGALFPLLLTPFLTRIYSESEFGIYTTYVAIVGIFCSFSTGRYDLAILESPSKLIAKHLAYLAGFISIVVSSISFVLLKSMTFFSPELGGIGELNNLIYLVPVSIVSISLIQITTYCLNREKLYKKIAVAKIIKSGFGSSTQLGLGILNIPNYGLVYGKLVGEVSAFLYGVVKIVHEEVFKGIKLKTRNFIFVAKKYSKYLTINSIHSFISVSTISSIPLMLGFFFDTEIVGYYGLSFSVCFLPVTLISQAVFQIFSREISIKIDVQGDYLAYFYSTAKKLVIVSFPIFTILFFFGDIIFEFVFGKDWLVAGQFSQILSPYLFTSFIVSPFTFVALKINRHEFTLKLELIGLFLKTCAVFFGSYYFNEYLALSFFSMIGVFMNLYLLFWVRSELKKL